MPIYRAVESVIERFPQGVVELGCWTQAERAADVAKPPSWLGPSKACAVVLTIGVLRGLRREGFEPFVVAQGASCVDGKAEFTKPMIRMRHAGQVQTRPEANEITLINSRDGASSDQMLAST